VDKNGDIEVIQNYPIHFVSSNIKQKWAYIKGGMRIIGSMVKKEKPFTGDEQEIITKIHQERFNPDSSHIITGGHFHQQYVRNLGIFYNAVLDARIPNSQQDWINRQRIALQSVSLPLEIFHQSKRTFTRIDPLKKHHYTGVNIYTNPSDSLFGILYMLNALIDPVFISQTFPSAKLINTDKQLKTVKAGKALLGKYKNDLIFLLKEYKKHSLDPTSNLIRKNIHLASARDGIKRTSAFYDNVIIWASFRLANQLNIIKTEEIELQNWKQTIIQHFWDEKTGIFLDDLSLESQKEKIFSADAFIVTSTNFLNRENTSDRHFLVKMFEYVKKEQLDKPFPLHYSKKNNLKKLYRPVKYFAPSYMGETIWSHWGIEYIKALILVAQFEPNLLKDAKEYLSIYKRNIESSGGYPELYNKQGNLPQGKYKSVLHNSWVINYEQAKMLFNAAIKHQG
jgi:hypothetical protein